MTTVNGARTVRLSLAGAYGSTLYFAFRGYTEIELDCQWQRYEADIGRGCADVQRTIRFVDQPR
jgi:hypothetical protein